MLPYQLIGAGCPVGNISASVGVQKDRLSRIGPVAILPPPKFLDGRFHDRQRIAALAFANVKMDRKTGLLRKEPNKGRVPDFAITFAADEEAAALLPITMTRRH